MAAFITGSRVWGTAEQNVSDWDLIIVLRDSAAIGVSLIPSDGGFALLERWIPRQGGRGPVEYNIELMWQSWYWNELVIDKANLQAISCLYLPSEMIYVQKCPDWRQQFEDQLLPWRIVRAVLWKVSGLLP